MTLQNTTKKLSAESPCGPPWPAGEPTQKTLALSVQKAIEAGALYVEIDIQLSLDQQPMVYHDISLKRVSGQDRTISSLTCSDLMALPAYEPERLGEEFIDETISSLNQVVDIILNHPQVTLFVELKEESIAEFGAEIMLANVCDALEPIRDRAVLISFDYSIIASRQGQRLASSRPRAIGMEPYPQRPDNSHRRRLHFCRLQTYSRDRKPRRPSLQARRLRSGHRATSQSSWQAAASPCLKPLILAAYSNNGIRLVMKSLMKSE